MDFFVCFCMTVTVERKMPKKYGKIVGASVRENVGENVGENDRETPSSVFCHISNE